MLRLADGVYAIVHDDATQEWPSGATDWPHGNTGVIVGDSGVLVVDSTYLPARAEADIALIRAVTDKPVRYLVNTHWHGDHTHGNFVYRRAFPDLTIVGQRANASFIELNLARAPRSITAPASATRKALQELESRLGAGRDATGRALTNDEKAGLARNIDRRRAELDGLATIQVAPPTLLFDRELTLELGGRRVELRDRGRANSPHDVTVYLPDERVLFAGDILVYPVPYAMQSHPVAWIDVLREIEDVPVTALVPGHGPVMHDHRYTRDVRELLEAARTRVAAQARTGVNSEDVQKRVTLGDFRARFVRPGEPTAELWDYSIQSALLERMWACLVGYRC